MSEKGDDGTHPFFIRVDKRLRDTGRTRTWLADKAGVSLNTLNAAYYRNTPPKIDIALSIADALRTSLDYLLAGDRDGLKGRPENDLDLSVETLCVWMRTEHNMSDEAIQACADVIMNLPMLAIDRLTELRGWIRGSLEMQGRGFKSATVDIGRIHQLSRRED